MVRRAEIQRMGSRSGGMAGRVLGAWMGDSSSSQTLKLRMMRTMTMARWVSEYSKAQRIICRPSSGLEGSSMGSSARVLMGRVSCSF